MPNYRVTILDRETNKPVLTSVPIVARDDIQAGVKVMKENEKLKPDDYKIIVKYDANGEEKESSYLGEVLKLEKE